MTSSVNRAHKSADRLAFEHYLRTGERLTSEEWTNRVECKFNPNHDPSNGQFTFAPGGAGQARRSQRPKVGSARKTPPMSQRDVEVHAAHAMGQYQREIARGKSPEEAAAWAANSEVESGGDPSRHQDGGGPGRGLFQWGSPKIKMDRRPTFQRVMKIPVDQATYDQQLDFRDWELRNTHKSTQRKMDAASTVAGKSRAITVHYLISKDVAGQSENRARIAEAIYRRAKGIR